MNSNEISGAQELLSMLNDEEVMSLKDTVTKSIIQTSSRTEAVNACLRCSQSAMELLRRKKMRRDILMQYLARKSITVTPGTDKVRLIKQIIELWNSNAQALVPSTNLQPVCTPSIQQLSREFTEWFFTSWNSLNNFTSENFFPDCQLTLVHENNRRVVGSNYVCDLLRSYVGIQQLLFYPNIPSNRVQESRHGLVIVQTHGTIHRHGTCIGIFEQSFGLIRDPMHSNNYLIKFSFLHMQTQQEQAQITASTISTPLYLTEIMQEYDQTVQQQIDATDYFIDEPDDDSNN